jgi:hypothetical protein
MHFHSSDFTWSSSSLSQSLFSVVDEDTRAVQAQVVDSDPDIRADADDEEESPFLIRIALSKLCTSNMNPIYCHQESK